MTKAAPRISTAAPAMSPAIWLQLGLLSVIWGGSFLFGRIAMEHLPALSTALARVAIAGAALWFVVAATRRDPSTLRPFLGALLVMGLLNNVVPFGLILWGQKEIGSGLASVINAMTPVWTLIVAQIATRDERITAAKASGMALAFAGVTVLIGREAFAGLSAPLLAQLAVLGASMSYGFASVWGRRFRGVDPLLVAVGQLTASTLLLIVPALALDRPWTLAAPPAEAAASVLALALVCTALAYVIFFRILAAGGAVAVSLVTFLIPVSAIALGAIFLDERVSRGELAGMALIALGLAVIDGRLRR